MSTEDQNTPFGGATPGLPDATLRALDVGQLVAGRFRLVRPLGKGGMGVVWLAKDESLGEEVAFKFLAEVIAQDEASLHDLKRELRRTRQLTHHHIIRVHDLVEDPARGVAGITMEVAAGGSLAARRAKTEHGWLEPHEIAEWARQLCDALDYAHRHARVVHRDLKPANLLLDAEGRLKIADFGIAAALHESATRLTAGKVSGTPPYMSPEQWQGFPPAPSDDLYALGATLYELLTGKPPFYSGNIAAAAMSLAPVPMTQRRRELEDVDAPLPPAWEEAIAALLAKTADARPASAGEVAARVAQPGGLKEISPGRQPGVSATKRVRPEEAPEHSMAPAGADAHGAGGPRVSPGANLPHPSGLTSRATRPPLLPSEVSAVPPAMSPRRGAVLAVLALIAVGLGGWFAATRSPEPTPVRLQVGSKVVKMSWGEFRFGPPFGYVDQTGKLVIQSQWDAAHRFADGLAPVERGSKWGFITPIGKLVIQPKWDSAGSFSEGLAPVRQGDDETGKWGFIDRTGKIVIQPQWGDAGCFADGLALVRQGDYQTRQYGFIDTTGKIVIPPQWDHEPTFSEGLAPVQQGGEYGFIDQTGKLVIQAKWGGAGHFSEGLAPVRRGDPLNAPLWGFIDQTGSLVIQPRWDEASSFSEGLAPVCQGGYWGFIDRTGKLVIQPQWDFVDSFIDGLARTQQGGKYGFIDRTGKVVVPLEWDDAWPEWIGEKRPFYRRLLKQTAPGRALAVWLGPDLKEIWRAELPLEEAEPAPARPASL